MKKLSWTEKIKFMGLMKEAFEHLVSIETAGNSVKKKEAERDWKRWKREHPNEITQVKKYIVSEVHRMAEDDLKFRDELVESLINIDYEEKGSGFKIDGDFDMEGEFL